MYKQKKDDFKLLGEFEKKAITAKDRFSLFIFLIFLSFFVIVLKISYINISNKKQITNNLINREFSTSGLRADIVDRNGVLLATSLIKKDLVANPNQIKKDDKEDVSKEIVKVLPELKYKEVLKKINLNKSFVYLKKNIEPKKYKEIENIGEPYIYSIEKIVRHYPHEEHASHILGGVNIDNIGIKGIEKKFNKILLDEKFVQEKKKLNLSVDINLQKILDSHLNYRISKHSAEGGAGIILDIKKNEILAMNSLPQYNPNHIEGMNNITEFNNATLGVYELGSLFKSLTGAIALDKNLLNEETVFDARKPLVVGKFKIHDFEAKEKKLKFSECILSSSNICFALIGELIGEKNIREYYQKMKLTNKPEIELPEIGNPIIPKIWRKTHIMTMSYGHGIAISPLQFVNAFSSIVNEGQFRYSTLIKDKYINNENFSQVITENTSSRIRYLLRENVRNKEGTGDNAEIEGFSVGGKTGTAIKNKLNRYNKKENISSFIGFFPSYNPKYLVFIMIDNPKPLKETGWYATGGAVAAPTVKEIINEMIPIIQIEPKIIEKDLLQQHVKLIN